nr:MAG TPA: hypothetical protein [Caudoviricetes sp.]
MRVKAVEIGKTRRIICKSQVIFLFLKEVSHDICH